MHVITHPGSFTVLLLISNLQKGGGLPNAIGVQLQNAIYIVPVIMKTLKGKIYQVGLIICYQGNITRVCEIQGTASSQSNPGIDGWSDYINGSNARQRG